MSSVANLLVIARFLCSRLKFFLINFFQATTTIGKFIKATVPISYISKFAFQRLQFFLFNVPIKIPLHFFYVHFSVTKSKYQERFEPRTQWLLGTANLTIIHENQIEH